MKKIKLEVLVDYDSAFETLECLRNLKINNIAFYCLSMEDCDG